MKHEQRLVWGVARREPYVHAPYRLGEGAGRLGLMGPNGAPVARRASQAATSASLACKPPPARRATPSARPALTPNSQLPLPGCGCCDAMRCDATLSTFLFTLCARCPPDTIPAYALHPCRSLRTLSTLPSATRFLFSCADCLVSQASPPVFDPSQFCLFLSPVGTAFFVCSLPLSLSLSIAATSPLWRKRSLPSLHSSLSQSVSQYTHIFRPR